jgi:hypothetical protein
LRAAALKNDRLGSNRMALSPHRSVGSQTVGARSGQHDALSPCSRASGQQAPQTGRPSFGQRTPPSPCSAPRTNNLRSPQPPIPTPFHPALHPLPTAHLSIHRTRRPTPASIPRNGHPPKGAWHVTMGEAGQPADGFQPSPRPRVSPEQGPALLPSFSRLASICSWPIHPNEPTFTENQIRFGFP